MEIVFGIIIFILLAIASQSWALDKAAGIKREPIMTGKPFFILAIIYVAAFVLGIALIGGP